MVGAALVAALAINPLSIRAQRKKNSGPRALAVVTWNGDSSTPESSTSVLTPVAILVEGRFYDAELYQAQPEPLAVDAGVIYDILKNGDPVGTFTVGGARQDKGIWYGLGHFDAKKEKQTQVAKSAPLAPSATTETDDDRPKLRRGPAPPPAPKEQTDAVLNNIDRDPERPTLRRQTAEERKAKSAATPAKEFVPPAMHMAVAVSDAGGPEARPFVFRAKPGETDQLRAAMEKLARAELDKQRKASKSPETKVATGRRPRSAPQASSPPLALQDAKFGVFDINGNNAPILAYSAAAMVDGIKKYITVAAWEEIDESLRKIFTQVTDDHHLDVYPRLEIIDAIDARGNGRGELLFRAFGDQGNRFVLYHPGPDSLELLFDSASAQSER
ncbi:MAG: hypothetical protein DMG64_01685 [Acidobacteria bacterium]|nr:MAG: hypothetical protein DMG64_01685 [Acidobacteriota bacterium]PYY24761.1 MAG: hypothetical protein DMG62_01305 [Acidobacteriota bacterium]